MPPPATRLWPSLPAARHTPHPRVPFQVAHLGQVFTIGSIPAAEQAWLLATSAGWAASATIQTASTVLSPTASGALCLNLPAPERQAWFTHIGLALRQSGRIRAWRDELYALFALPGHPPEEAGESAETSAANAQPPLLAHIERATARFWGSLTFGAHANGYVADAVGRPVQVWVARRSLTKPTDPGMLDNLVGGGVPLGQTPSEALLREAWEEAGLLPHQLQAVQRGSALHIEADIREGRQLEWLYVFDVPLPAGLTPVNQDGEVAGLECLPVAEALAHAAAGRMTTDASLAMLDFGLRHQLLAADAPEAAALRALAVPAPQAAWFDPAWG
ncbi:NUDIX hydrolase [Ideonella margarita]|uniref:NUDIX domain-containing protein n=1 Tax=Ideonella margarita TaxID=2984191 RepID=A0ABU9C5W7_9BURK